MMRIFGVFALAALGVCISGCSNLELGSMCSAPSVAVVKLPDSAVKLDGVPDEKVWQSVPAYELVLRDNAEKIPGREKARIMQDEVEKGSIRFAYDDKYFYAAGVFEDKDILAEKSGDEASTATGDGITLLIAPEDAFAMWSFFVAPNGGKNSYFERINGMKSPDINYIGIDGFEAAGKINGILNDHSSKDKCWTVEMRVPLKVLSGKGVKFAPGSRWKVLVVRHNYSHFLYRMQNTSYPDLPMNNYGLRQYFAKIDFR